MRPRSSYLICATARSGSNLLCELLRRTGVAGDPAEHFMWPYEETLARSGTKAPAPHGPLSFRAYYERILEDCTGDNGVFGTKIMWDEFGRLVEQLRALFGFPHAPIPQLVSAAFPNLRYISISRRDKVRQAVSLARTAERRLDEWL